MERSWIKIQRKILESQVFSDPELFRLWIWCICKANWKPGYFRSEPIPRGSFATGRNSAAVELELHPSKFRRYLARLEEFGCIRIEPTTKFTLIHVEKYEVYQSLDPQSDHQADHQKQRKPPINRPSKNVGKNRSKRVPAGTKNGKPTIKNSENRPSTDHQPTIDRPSIGHRSTTIEEGEEREEGKEFKEVTGDFGNSDFESDLIAQFRFDLGMKDTRPIHLAIEAGVSVSDVQQVLLHALAFRPNPKIVHGRLLKLPVLIKQGESIDQLLTAPWPTEIAETQQLRLQDQQHEQDKLKRRARMITEFDAQEAESDPAKKDIQP